MWFDLVDQGEHIVHHRCQVSCVGRPDYSFAVSRIASQLSFVRELSLSMTRQIARQRRCISKQRRRVLQYKGTTKATEVTFPSLTPRHTLVHSHRLTRLDQCFFSFVAGDVVFLLFCELVQLIFEIDKPETVRLSRLFHCLVLVRVR